MRRTIRILVGTTVTALAFIVPVTSARAATIYECPQGFQVDYSAIDATHTVPVPDGTGLPGGFVANNTTLTTGRYVATATNHSTGYSITSAENGPVWTTDDPTPTPGAVQSFTQIGTGNQVNRFGPRSEAALAAKGIHVPVLAYTKGLLILHVIVISGLGGIVDNLSLNGHLVDGCALLAAGS